MTEARKLVQGLLWQWIDELDDPDAEQRGWKVDYVDGMLAATEAFGLLETDELVAFREIAAAGSVPPAVGDRAVAEAQLETLKAELRPMRRDPDPDGLQAAQRFHGALEALTAAGLLSPEAGADWHGRALGAEAPWLDDPHGITSQAGFAYAIAIPPETPEEAADDALAMEQIERMSHSGDIREVLVSPRPARVEGLAITAVISRTESVDLHFHHVGPPQGELSTGFANLEAFRSMVDALTPPALRDDVGTVYEPAGSRPVSSTGTGGMPDPQRPQVIKGHWRYFPAPPENATSFAVTQGDGHWSLGAPGGASGESRG